MLQLREKIHLVRISIPLVLVLVLAMVAPTYVSFAFYPTAIVEPYKMISSTLPAEDPLLSVVMERQVPGEKATLTFFDVGHGDCALVEYVGKVVMVDAATAQACRDKVIPRLKQKGISKIDALIVTHFHPDHIGGLPELRKEFEIGEIIQSGTTMRDFFAVIDPEEELRLYAGENDRSLITAFNIHGEMVLIFGDNEFYSQSEFCKEFLEYQWSGEDWERKPLEVKVLKYPHHGVHDYPLFEDIEAESVVISCGTDALRWNVPTTVIKQYEGIGSKVYWTAKDGDVEIAF
ncbi:MAG: MBL fold metallo-hydrolase [Actinomycetota bacterium]|nr:MBL fold metallo-hydrolase [Actinomycetota bacterium]